jgi:hypothetical protein
MTTARLVAYRSHKSASAFPRLGNRLPFLSRREAVEEERPGDYEADYGGGGGVASRRDQDHGDGGGGGELALRAVRLHCQA